MATQTFTNANESGHLLDLNNYTNNDTLNTTSSPHLGLERFLLYDVTININKYFLWVILVVGFPGNLLSLLTILRMPTVSSSKMHVAILAIIDNCAIVNKFLFHQLTEHLVRLGDVGCKVLLFTGNFFSILASWILVAMTLERFIAVWFPLKVSRIYSKKKATIVLIVIFFLTFSFNTVYFVIVIENVKKSCVFHDSFRTFMQDYWYWADALAYAIVPCLLVITSNTLIIINVQMSSKTQRQLTNNFDQSSRRMRDQQQITTMLIVISLVFLVLMLPNSIFYLVSEHWLKTTAPGSYRRMEYHFTKQLVHTLSDTNHAVNFYLYFLSMATFRRRFLDTILCRKPARKPKGANSSVFKTSHSYVSFHSTHSNLKSRADLQHSHSLTNVSDVSSEV
ncbi:kappa-type opioid receptor-like [Babylonia areolata]|uniref:kappa-type opioid receptor-like n=1 Tax=Babylonia areolata TaxID=304850 RepID=UPI003FD34064